MKSGANNKKIGSRVTKGKWKGFPIYYFTLEERATCPRSCKMWDACYGNQMPFALRYVWSQKMKRAMQQQLHVLNRRYPKGFVVRLHILGDFMSEDYARRWIKWLDKFPALHIYGYTARTWEWLHEYAKNNWDRFAIRYSGSTGDRGSYVTETPLAPGVTCPAQTGKSDCCGTCTLCWATEKPINFLSH